MSPTGRPWQEPGILLDDMCLPTMSPMTTAYSTSSEKGGTVTCTQLEDQPPASEERVM